MRLADAIGMRLDGMSAVEARLNGTVVWPAGSVAPAPTLVGATRGGGGGSPWAYTIPAGTTAGDLIVMRVTLRMNADAIAANVGTTPSGWTRDPHSAGVSVSGNGAGEVWFYRIASGSDTGGSVAMGGGLSRTWITDVMTFRGVDATAPYSSAVQATSAVNNATPVDIGCPSVTTPKPNCLRLISASLCSGSALGSPASPFTNPSGFTEIAQGTQSGNQANYIGYRVEASAGATGGQSIIEADYPGGWVASTICVSP